MSDDKQNWFFSKCKKAKVLYDTVKMVKVIVRLVVGLLSVGGVYLATDIEIEPEAKPKPVTADKVDELKIIHVNPEYALKSHTHSQPAQTIIDHTPSIKQAIEEYNKKHDPQKLGH